MKLALWAVLAFLAIALALQDQLRYNQTGGDDLDGINVTRRWNDPPPQIPSDQVWNNALCKGHNLWMDMFKDNGQIDPRMIKTWELQETAAWGYRIQYRLLPQQRNLGGLGLPPSNYGIARALASLGKSDRDRQDGGLIVMCEIFHWNPDQLRQVPPIPIDQQTYAKPSNPVWRPPPQNGPRNRYTGMSSQWGYSVADGVIINTNIKSAISAARERNPPVPFNDLPEIRTLSDLQFTVWEEEASYINDNAVNNLQWYFVASILNEEARQIIKGALMQLNQGIDQPLRPWPGLWVPITVDAGRAILGSPVGKTLGYFLVQHKQKLGNMWVDGVVIFQGDTMHGSACLAFHIRQPAPRPLTILEINPLDPIGDPMGGPQRLIPDPRV
ncbi:hypothetical protein DPSP01_012186 [Paraphaeosphaeria sporulosa]|uniref:Uncharacterized protein n=1 Tax=Paraphaeosphaeria sporulosa TaxID=1460663 RepID=A0A177C2M2_9PLEO|nr:uncharacterized protein CC84DRAFT_1229644 [Paraphaeosphaeria sporulosa]OAG00987.1 hypothetical protein CC84DRAFT_1229644 [Paraphaeosphaeria sporulosa]